MPAGMPGTTSKRHALLVQEQRFGAAAVEDERVAPLQPRDGLALARLLRQQVADRFLLERLRRGGADVDLLRVRPRRAQQPRRHEMVVQHDVGRRETLQAADGDEAGIARTGADEVDDAHTFVVRRSTFVVLLWRSAFVGSLVRRSLLRSLVSTTNVERRTPNVTVLSPLRLCQNLARAVREQLRADACAELRPRRASAPRAWPRTARLPSSATTTATSSSSSPSTTDASAPTGVWQPPPSASTSARSAVSASPAAASSMRDDRVARARVVGANLDRDDALAGRRHARRRRERPARCATRTRAASVRPPPAPAHRARLRRACATACRDCRESPVKRAPGNSRVSCAMRRTLPVPIEGDGPSAATRSSIMAMADGYGRWRMAVRQPSALSQAMTTTRPADLLAAARRRSSDPPAAPPTCPCCCARRGRSRRRAARPRFP